jgi:hypothetical protein
MEECKEGSRQEKEGTGGSVMVAYHSYYHLLILWPA